MIAEYSRELDAVLPRQQHCLGETSFDPILKLISLETKLSTFLRTLQHWLLIAMDRARPQSKLTSDQRTWFEADLAYQMLRRLSQRSNKRAQRIRSDALTLLSARGTMLHELQLAQLEGRLVESFSAVMACVLDHLSKCYSGKKKHADAAADLREFMRNILDDDSLGDFIPATD